MRLLMDFYKLVIVNSEFEFYIWYNCENYSSKPSCETRELMQVRKMYFLLGIFRENLVFSQKSEVRLHMELFKLARANSDFDFTYGTAAKI